MNNDQLNQNNEVNETSLHKDKKNNLNEKSTKDILEEPMIYFCSYNARESNGRELQANAKIHRKLYLNFIDNIDISGKLFSVKESDKDLTKQISKVHIKDCIVNLDNPHRTYYVGETITGHVLIMFDAPKVIRTIYTYILGEVFVKVGQNKSTDIFHRGKRQYLEGYPESQQITISAGFHQYHFSHLLPLDIPSTFEGGKYGCILYTLLVVLNCSWRENLALKFPITVIDHINLNLIPSVKEPFTLYLEKSFGCWCCRSLPVTVSTSIPKTGYFCGQNILIKCECDNESKFAIQRISFKLYERVAYKLNKMVESHRCICQTSIGPVKSGDVQIYNVALGIPTGLNASILNCKYIRLKYELKVVCSILFTSLLKFTGTIPITLGNKLRKSFMRYSDSS